jgi:hypothetical protein
MLTGYRQVEYRGVGVFASTRIDHHPAYCKNSVPKIAQADVVFKLAGDYASLASDAAIQIYNKTISNHRQSRLLNLD